MVKHSNEFFNFKLASDKLANFITDKIKYLNEGRIDTPKDGSLVLIKKNKLEIKQNGRAIN
jgi:hypothetical protein